MNELTFLGKLIGGEKVRSKYIPRDALSAVLFTLMPENRLACMVSLATGLRIGDVLNLKVEDIKKGDFTIKEEKTGKRKRVHLGNALQCDLLAIAGRVYVFEHRTDWKRHRTRQAVFKDIKRAARLLRLKGASPHSMRKVYAANRYHLYGGNVRRVQKLLNHSSEAVTMLYALSDALEQNKKSA